MKEYVVIYERGENNWGAIVPELPGCFSLGDSFEEVRENVKEAIELYIDHLTSKGEQVPEPSMQVGTILIAS